jgi:hypothetical protein
LEDGLGSVANEERELLLLEGVEEVGIPTTGRGADELLEIGGGDMGALPGVDDIGRVWELDGSVEVEFAPGGGKPLDPKMELFVDV